jgi:hypothetical protein
MTLFQVDDAGLRFISPEVFADHLLTLPAPPNLIAT